MNPDFWRRAAPALSAVGSMTASIVAGVLLGTWLDGEFGTSPAFGVTLSLAGLGVGAAHVARRMKQPPP